MDPSSSALLTGAPVAIIVVLIKVIDYLLKRRSREGSADDRGALTEAIKDSSARTNELLAEAVNEIKGLRKDIERQGAEMHDMRQALTRVQENQAVMLDRQKHNGSAA